MISSTGKAGLNSVEKPSVGVSAALAGQRLWRSTKGRRPPCRAFSLVELLVCLAVFSIGIIAVLQALAFSARSAGLCVDMTEAVCLADSMLQGIEFQHGALAHGQHASSGSRDRFSWDYAFETERGTQLERLTYTLRWERMDRKQEIRVVTYLR